MYGGVPACIVLPAYAGMIRTSYTVVPSLRRVLPAYAGMIPSRNKKNAHALGAPRVCGDDPSKRRSMSSNLVVLPAYAGMIP